MATSEVKTVSAREVETMEPLQLGLKCNMRLIL